MDIYSEAASSYEGATDAGSLRTPPNFTKEERMILVHETLQLLELASIAGEMVGRLSVEPMRCLDERSVFNVMRVVDSINLTGSAVLPTIHLVEQFCLRAVRRLDVEKAKRAEEFIFQISTASIDGQWCN